MHALVTMRHTPERVASADRLRDRGKPPRVVIAAAMRKPVTTANALIRDQRKRKPETA
jgi:hypothetical protein